MSELVLLTVYFNLCRRPLCPQSVPKCHVSVARTAYPLQQVSITHHHLKCYYVGGWATRGQHSGLGKRSIQQYSTVAPSRHCALGSSSFTAATFLEGFFFFSQFFKATLTVMSSRATRKSKRRRWHVLHTCRTQLCVLLDYKTIVGGCSSVLRSVIVFLALSDFSAVLFSSIITRSVWEMGLDAGAKFLRDYSLSGEKKIQFNTFHNQFAAIACITDFVFLSL